MKNSAGEVVGGERGKNSKRGDKTHLTANCRPGKSKLPSKGGDLEITNNFLGEKTWGGDLMTWKIKIMVGPSRLS